MKVHTGMNDEIDIYQDLKMRLISNGFEHGAKVRAEELRKVYGCSASAVREVLFRLAAVGLVDFQEQKGFRVPMRSPQKLIELTHVRVLLEAEGTAMSIRNGGVDWEARLTAAHHKLSHIEKRIHAATDPSNLVDIWFSAEREFHETLLSACGSETLQESHLHVFMRFRQQLMIADRSFSFISANIEHHYQIMVAALAGDEAETRQKIHDHLARHLDPANRTQDAGVKSSAM